MGPPPFSTPSRQRYSVLSCLIFALSLTMLATSCGSTSSAPTQGKGPGLPPHAAAPGQASTSPTATAGSQAPAPPVSKPPVIVVNPAPAATYTPVPGATPTFTPLPGATPTFTPVPPPTPVPAPRLGVMVQPCNPGTGYGGGPLARTGGSGPSNIYPQLLITNTGTADLHWAVTTDNPNVYPIGTSSGTLAPNTFNNVTWTYQGTFPTTPLAVTVTSNGGNWQQSLNPC